MIIESQAFAHGEAIPQKYTCDGRDISPPLTFDEIPENAKSLVLICDDPDAPVGLWVHWLVYNLPPDIAGLSEGSELPASALEGENSWGRNDYGGPCPPGGTHRYFFKLYALDSKLDLPEGADKKTLEQAMQDHILDHCELMGTYRR